MRKTKKIFAVVLSLLCVMGTVNIRGVYAGEYTGTVIYVVNGVEKQVKVDDANQSIGGTDNHGAPWDKGGSGNKEYFQGWSEEPDYNKKDGRLFYSYEKFKDAYPDGIPEGLKLYPIYFKQLDITGYDKDNNLDINKGKTAEKTLPDSKVKEDTFSKKEKGAEKEAVVYYDEDKDSYLVKFDSSFKMNKSVAHWLYTGNGHSIMTNTQRELDSTSVKAPYTHVDLNVEIPEEIDVPEKLNLTFESYYFQPYMALDSNRNKMDIEEVQGAQKWNISTLAVNTAPKTTFTVLNPGKSRKIIIRTVLRTNSGIKGTKISNLPASAIENAEMKLVSNTALSISKENAKKLLKENRKAVTNGNITGHVKLPEVSVLGFSLDLSRNINRVDANNPIAVGFAPVTVHFNRNTAKFGDKQKQSVQVGDSGKDYSRASLNGTLNSNTLFENENMPADLAGYNSDDNQTYIFKGWSINPDAKEADFTGDTKLLGDVTAYAVWQKVEYRADFKFRDAEKLPEDVMKLLPKAKTGLANNENVKAPEINPDKVKVKDGVWSFKGWDKDEKTVSGSNIEFEGIWEFAKDESPSKPDDSNKSQKPKKDIPKEKQGGNSAVNTGDESNMIFHAAGLAISITIILLLMYFRRKEDR